MTDAEQIAALTAEVADLRKQLAEARAFNVKSKEAHRLLLLKHHDVKVPLLRQIAEVASERDELIRKHEPERLPPEERPARP